jgi:hypothetical protein
VLDPGVVAPVELVHERFVATPLTVTNAALDHDAYMVSPDVIRVHSDARWPHHGFTLADDLQLVAKHEADHEARRAFTFVLLAPSKTEAAVQASGGRSFWVRRPTDSRMAPSKST